MGLTVPQMLRIPPKLEPLITNFNDYDVFVIVGGRASAKTQSVGRTLLYIGEKRKVRVFCGRELQSTIEESVHAVLSDLIVNNTLAYRINEKKIRHYLSGTEFKFKGFREQGAINIKGVEGADIVWVDEAQSLTKPTLDVLIPTIRKQNSKLIFTMNRHTRDDAVLAEFASDPRCLIIQINYDDNPYCPEITRRRALDMKQRDPRAYKHIYLGEPISASSDYLFNYDKLWRSLETKPFGDLFLRQRILSIDFAAQGDDMCVASILDRVTSQHWQLSDQISWGEPDTTITVGKIARLIGTFKPDVTILDIGGGGHNVHCDLTNMGLEVVRFDGGSNVGVDTTLYKNQRAAGYYLTKDWFEDEFLIIPPHLKSVLKQLEKIKMRWYDTTVRGIERKDRMKATEGFSPDEADSLMMGVYAAMNYLGKANSAATSIPDRAVIRRSQGRKK